MEQEEFGASDLGEAEVERDRFRGTFASIEGADAADDEIDSFEPPRDPAP